jgi:hypothetical protein
VLRLLNHDTMRRRYAGDAILELRTASANSLKSSWIPRLAILPPLPAASAAGLSRSTKHFQL